MTVFFWKIWPKSLEAPVTKYIYSKNNLLQTVALLKKSYHRCFLTPQSNCFEIHKSAKPAANLINTYSKTSLTNWSRYSERISLNHLLAIWGQLKPFVPNAPFLYTLKTTENPTENLTVFWCFQGAEKGCIENEWVKKNIKFN